MLVDSTDRPGHSLRLLVWQALQLYRVKALLPFLKDGDAIVRICAANELRVRGGRVVFNHVRKMLASHSETDRELAAFILGQLGTPRRPFARPSIGLLIRRLKVERSVEVREAILYSLGQLNAGRAVSRVLPHAKDRSPKVRAGAAFAIGASFAYRWKFMPADARQELEKLRKDTSASVRSTAKLAMEIAQLPPSSARKKPNQ